MGGWDMSETENMRWMDGKENYGDAEWVSCPYCRGTGDNSMDKNFACTFCQGQGELPIEREKHFKGGK